MRALKFLQEAIQVVLKSEPPTPIGAVIAFYGLTAPKNYLLCDGSEFDKDEYSELFALLGKNTVPDLRETAIVGVGENTTSPIADHDIYNLGEFKDDQSQGHTHNTSNSTAISGAPGNSYGVVGTLTGKVGNHFLVNDPIQYNGYGTPRYGTTTHGKQMGLNYIIHAKN